MLLPEVLVDATAIGCSPTMPTARCGLQIDRHLACCCTGSTVQVRARHVEDVAFFDVLAVAAAPQSAAGARPIQHTDLLAPELCQLSATRRVTTSGCCRRPPA